MKNIIRELRARERMTQEDLGKKVGVSRQTILSIERGDYNPSLTLSFKIARAFSAGVEDIFLYD